MKWPPSGSSIARPLADRIAQVAHIDRLCNSTSAGKKAPLRKKETGQGAAFTLAAGTTRKNLSSKKEKRTPPTPAAAGVVVLAARSARLVLTTVNTETESRRGLARDLYDLRKRVFTRGARSYARWRRARRAAVLARGKQSTRCATVAYEPGCRTCASADRKSVV